ncbi:odorant receptor 4-like [Cydia pomonella]|uniref:odorant receptor 4-like n=1 Tax=Cydia pomonella TaxID=82600 RepID=UPI002ADE2145|nr:odorant receptor 4-like [Cydia pomonella]
MDAKARALTEIYKSLELCNYCTRMIGLSFIDAVPSNAWARARSGALYAVSALAVMLLVAGEITYVAGLVINTSSVAEFVSSLHIVGYGMMGTSKLLTLWFKRHTFRRLLIDLAEIWPVTCENEEEDKIKEESLRALRLGQSWYTFFNVFGVAMYNITPIGVYLYRRIQNQPSDLGYVWHATYPFDKTKSIYHEFVYAFEVFSGTSSVWGMLGSDMMFTTMASHISMLLRQLQVKVRRLAANADPAGQSLDSIDCYGDIVKLVKIHQRLISYRNDMEDTFSFLNLINVLFSSGNICCVVFVIVLLEPWMDMSNKLFLGAVMTQVGILCSYADDVYRASVGVADAVYESGWWAADGRARMALLVLMQRSQKPLYFTALKFGPITMTTYRSIITNSYSYFTLLYTVYRSD